jgi:predicted phage baseplate assembly protein
MRRPPELRADGRSHPLPPDLLEPGGTPYETIVWHLETDDGTPVTVEAPARSVHLAPPLKDDEVVSEVLAIARSPLGVTSDAVRTTLMLKTPLANCYERSTVSINANVAPATHGETVGEIAGGGDFRATSQALVLKQTPLTYVSSADEPSGRKSTLEVRVNDVLWHEVPSLYGSRSQDRVYALTHSDDDSVTIRFGDGVNGARLPRGDSNVRLRYRKGIGTAGNLRPGQLSLLVTRPLGVKSVTNPDATTGGQDPEPIADARRNAPLPILTFGRAVSVRDYVDYARSFAGIAKADGLWISDARVRGICLTVAGPAATAIRWCPYRSNPMPRPISSSAPSSGSTRTPRARRSYGRRPMRCVVPMLSISVNLPSR